MVYDTHNLSRAPRTPGDCPTGVGHLEEYEMGHVTTFTGENGRLALQLTK